MTVNFGTWAYIFQAWKNCFTKREFSSKIPVNKEIYDETNIPCEDSLVPPPNDQMRKLGGSALHDLSHTHTYILYIIYSAHPVGSENLRVASQ